jgi:hypothetical protein
MKLTLMGFAYAWAILSASIANGYEKGEEEAMMFSQPAQQCELNKVVPQPSPVSPTEETLVNEILLSPRPVEMQ